MSIFHYLEEHSENFKRKNPQLSRNLDDLRKELEKFKQTPEGEEALGEMPEELPVEEQVAWFKNAYVQANNLTTNFQSAKDSTDVLVNHHFLETEKVITAAINDMFNHSNNVEGMLREGRFNPDQMRKQILQRLEAVHVQKDIENLNQGRRSHVNVDYVPDAMLAVKSMSNDAIRDLTKTLVHERDNRISFKGANQIRNLVLSGKTTFGEQQAHMLSALDTIGGDGISILHEIKSIHVSGDAGLVGIAAALNYSGMEIQTLKERNMLLYHQESSAPITHSSPHMSSSVNVSSELYKESFRFEGKPIRTALASYERVENLHMTEKMGYGRASRKMDTNHVLDSNFRLRNMVEEMGRDIYTRYYFGNKDAEKEMRKYALMVPNSELRHYVMNEMDITKIQDLMSHIDHMDHERFTSLMRNERSDAFARQYVLDFIRTEIKGEDLILLHQQDIIQDGIERSVGLQKAAGYLYGDISSEGKDRIREMSFNDYNRLKKSKLPGSEVLKDLHISMSEKLPDGSYKALLASSEIHDEMSMMSIAVAGRITHNAHLDYDALRMNDMPRFNERQFAEPGKAKVIFRQAYHKHNPKETYQLHAVTEEELAAHTTFKSLMNADNAGNDFSEKYRFNTGIVPPTLSDMRSAVRQLKVEMVKNSDVEEQFNNEKQARLNYGLVDVLDHLKEIMNAEVYAPQDKKDLEIRAAIEDTIDLIDHKIEPIRIMRKETRDKAKASFLEKQTPSANFNY